MALISEDLRGEVLWSPTEGIGSPLDDLGEAKISQFKVPLGVYQQVLRLEIPVDHIERVHVLEHKRDLRGIEAGLGRRELPDCPQIGEQLSSLDELQHDIEILRVLADPICPDVKVEIEGVQNEDLVFEMVHLLALDYLVFLELLENKVLLGFHVLDKLDPSEGALAQDTEDFVVGELYLLRIVELECLLDWYFLVHLNYNKFIFKDLLMSSLEEENSS